MTIVLLVFAVLGAGCATVFPRNIVPEQLSNEAELAGMPNIRVWGDAPAESFVALFRAERHKMAAFTSAVGRSEQQSRAFNIVAISGGADNGAFGAGLLVGWSDAGTRPDFDVVTGVSAGALTAPFVYLGQGKDVQLREIFTKYTRSDIYDPGIIAPLFGGGLVDSSPLGSLIANYVDEAFLRDVARERKKGRILLIGTTNLDAERPVLWDMGRIAMSGHPQALSLFRKVLLASASIPGAFPPVRIKVRAGGQTYEELHVDGGVTQQVFVPPSSVAGRGLGSATKASPARRLFIIRNGKITPEWEAVEEGIFSISRRSVFTLIKSQSIGDLYRIYVNALADGTDFNLAAIPSSFSVRWAEPFEKAYMQALYDEGYRSGVQGYRWIKVPPGLATRSKIPTLKRPETLDLTLSLSD
ncbi:putative acylesterase/phospholipase RssA [Pseudorhodoplanes sinuspersici]|uniref:Patatin n=1 Tax=Pseudorhodoplanes sinuspersici TaxID=1235591 RepID=A0A1W6ZKL6_9HYPH|nr:patatin-like phospholipase family protein [Pseudorhodoplanes sinuspersici]ARP97862.1 patatin [Pseudorhodoplanes sinuspersici]RKE68404.1 putative acylesterase/phospholipase RssA [Pseudorhodoplanes sinuspersici]